MERAETCNTLNWEPIACKPMHCRSREQAGIVAVNDFPSIHRSLHRVQLRIYLQTRDESPYPAFFGQVSKIT